MTPRFSDTASALGAAAGQHALVLWLLGSALALALAGWLGARWRRRRTLGARHWALCCALPALALFTLLATQVAAGASMTHFDAALARTLQVQASATLLHWATVPTWAGDPPVVITLVAAVGAWLLWRRERLLALAWVAAVVGNALLNKGLKHLFERARPPHLHGIVHETGYSFPSGHASGTLAAYGMLAYVVLRLAPPAWHMPALLGAAWLAWTGACSRVLLQVHYASDVLAGLASGSVWLGLCILGLRHAQQRERPMLLNQ